MPRHAAPDVLDQTLPRPRLERRLDEGVHRRLTVVVAGAGYGKSTLVARWAHGRDDAAWYALDALDGSVARLVRGLMHALEPLVGEETSDLRAILTSASPAASDAQAQTGLDQGRSDALADLVCEHLAATDRSVTIVLDDLQELWPGGDSMRFVERLVRGAPPNVHVMLVSRAAVPFAIERLRGQGQVTELGPDRLAFTEAETAAMLERLGDDAATLAPALQRATNGWPAAVRLAVEALADAAPDRRRELIDRLGRPEGPLFAYVAEEVVDGEPEEVRRFLQVAARLEWFDGPLLEAVGVADAERILADLRRRALFIDFDSSDETYQVHALLRGVVQARLPLRDDEARAIGERAAAWFEAHDRPRDALEALVALDDPAAIAAFLTRHDQRLLSSVVADRVVEAVERVPAADRSTSMELLLADARIMRGEWDQALRILERAAGDGESWDPAISWRIGTIHHQRGALDMAHDAFERTDLQSPDDTNLALALGWWAYATWTVGDMAPFRSKAADALAAAQRSGDDRALALAYLAGAAHANAAGEAAEGDRLFQLSIAAAERAGWALILARAHNDFGFHLDRQGRYAEALRANDHAVSLYRGIGDVSFLALALADRGEAHLGLGHVEEAAADLRASMELFDRVGSRWRAWPLVRMARLSCMKGELRIARERFEEAIRAATALGDEMVHSEALAGLAQLIVDDDPDEASRMAERAVEIGQHGYQTQAIGGAAIVALRRRDGDAAEHWATKLLEVGRARSDSAAVATALDILAIVGARERDQKAATTKAMLDEAATLWRQCDAPFNLAENLLVRASLLDGRDALEAAREAERLAREIGARGTAEKAAARIDQLAAASKPPLMVCGLGRFRVVRDGEPVPAGEWQSKKARDLLRLLVARRGRPVAREAIYDELWPDEDDPEPLGNRLAVALAIVRSVLDPAKSGGVDHYVVADKQAVALDLEHLPVDIELFFRLAETGLAALEDGDRGRALEQLSAADAAYAGDPFEDDAEADWAVALREQAAATYVSVARALAGLASERGDVDGATRHWLRILERDPYDEGAHLELVRLLDRAGRHGESRRRYGVYVTRMAEIDVEAAPFPSPARAA